MISPKAINPFLKWQHFCYEGKRYCYSNTVAQYRRSI